jgi:phosphoribosylaminoimidazole carboxylase
LYGFPFVLKNKRLAYDGRGNRIIKSEADIDPSFEALGKKDIYAEKWVPFVKELAVMVVRSTEGIHCFPVVETVQKDSICNLVLAPAQISEHARSTALSLATTAVGSLSGLGVFGVEMFLLPDDSVLLNEIAPR